MRVSRFFATALVAASLLPLAALADNAAPAAPAAGTEMKMDKPAPVKPVHHKRMPKAKAATSSPAAAPTAPAATSK